MDRHAQREYLIVEITQAIVHHAQDLLEKHPLRAFDAIQLACGLESHASLREADLPALIFVSADKRLLAAASAEGLAVEDPNTHP